MTATIQSLFSVCEVELVYRNKVQPADRRKVTTSKSAYDIFLQAWDMNKIELVEHCYLMMLDRSNTVLGMSLIGVGGVEGCYVDPKIIYATALKARASGVLLAHNHPSGNLNPSRADRDLTNKLVEGGKLLDIKFLDHQIVTPQTYYSLADEGLIP